MKDGQEKTQPGANPGSQGSQRTAEEDERSKARQECIIAQAELAGISPAEALHFDALNQIVANVEGKNATALRKLTRDAQFEHALVLARAKNKKPPTREDWEKDNPQ